MKDWSTVASENDVAGSINFAEGQLPSTVNNSMRQVMADGRAAFDDMEWRDWGHVPTFTAANAFTVPGNQTGIYKAGRRVRLTDATTIYGVVVSSSFTTVTSVQITPESGSLSASLVAVSVGWDASKATQSIANFYVGRNQYLSNDITSPAAALDVDAIIAGAWESIGPTGGGATNTWTALDLVPKTSKGVILKVYVTARDDSAASGTRDARNALYARVTGSSATNNVASLIAEVRGTIILDGAVTANTFDAGACAVTVVVPVDTSIRFDLFNTRVGSAHSTEIYLAGWVDSLF